MLPLKPVYTPWQSIAMNYITDPRLGEDCDQLWGIDKLTQTAASISPKKSYVNQRLEKIFAGKC
jgi:hypothetical protein